MPSTTSLPIRIFRFARLLLHIVSGFSQSLFYPYFSQSVQRWLIKNWAIGFLNILNIKLHCNGKLPTIKQQRVLFVANHISWLDVCTIIAACPTRFVAKSEISKWPIIGLLSKNVGTLFIKRAKRRDTLRINKSISDVLSTGDRVVIFPEGTTSDGTTLHHFHASLLQSAVTIRTQLYPLAICYRHIDGTISKEAAYVNHSLLFSLRQILSQTRIDAELTFIDPIDTDEKNRRELARLSEQAIANALSLPVARMVPGKFSGLRVEQP